MSDPMPRITQLKLLADYNVWMNAKVYAAAASLPEADLLADRGAFFGSILGTLEHLVVGDTLWLKRFADHPAGGPLAPVRDLPKPTALAQIQFGALEPLKARRDLLDGLITDFVASLREDDLDIPLAYRNSRDEPFARALGLLLVHAFNHQTHHRGQVSTLLFQAGVDIGVTDLLALIPLADRP